MPTRIIIPRRIKKCFVYLIRLESKWRYYFIVFLAFLLYLVLYPSLVETLIVKPLAPLIATKSTILGDYIFGFILVFSLFSFAIKLYISVWKKDPGRSDFFWPIVLLLFYLTHRLGCIRSPGWYFSSFKSVSFLKYFDSIILLVVYVIYNPEYSSKKTNKHNDVPRLLEDDLFSINGGVDLYRRGNYADYIAQTILNENPKTSYAIAIKGSWGSGKSIFLKQVENRIHYALKIRFNPWLSKSTDDVLADFFRVVLDKTAPYDRKLSKRIKSYYRNILKIDETFAQKAFSTFGLLKDAREDSLEDQQVLINNRLREYRLKLVIIIDDLDRLNSAEILLVLKLIRNSFNFRNTFFLVAYDEAYLTTTLEKKSVPNKFLQKIFQLEIDLPGFPFSLLENQIIEVLTQRKTEEQKKEIIETIKIISQYGIWKRTVKNMRDIIRLANSFNHQFWKKEKEIDYVDFLLLEVIKLQYANLYKEIRESMISFPSVSFMIMPTSFDDGSKVIKVQNTPEYSAHEYPYILLDKLFNRQDHFDPVKSIRVVGNSIRYFSDDLFGVIAYSDFDSYKEEGFSGFKKLIDLHHQKNNLDEVLQKIFRVNSFETVASFFNINKGLLYICNLEGNYRYVNNVNVSYQKNYLLIKNAIPDDAMRSEFIKKLFSSGEYDALAESQVLGQLLYSKIRSQQQESEVEVDEKLVRDILIENLEFYIRRNNSRFNSMVFDIYYQIAVGIEGNRLIISTEANQILREYVSRNQNSYFKEWLFRPKEYGNFKSNEFVLEPFIGQYLGYEKFEELLFSQENSFEILKLKAFYNKYKKNRFEGATYFRNLVEIQSDRETIFIKSAEYPNLKEGNSAVRTQKVSYSSRHNELMNSEWIAQSATITYQEALYGGTYLFERQFNLQGSTKRVKSAVLYLLVDDYVTYVEINGEKIEVNFFDYNLERPHKIEKIPLIENGNNVIRFEVRNKSVTDEGDLMGRAENNPYDFIYNLVILYEDEVFFDIDSIFALGG